MSLNLNHHSLSAEALIKICRGENVSGQETPKTNTPVDKTAFFTAPNGLVKFEIPNKKVQVKFDVLEFKLTNPLHKDFINAGVWDVRGQYYWNYFVTVHEAFPKSIVCMKNYEVGKKAKHDAVCDLLWNEKALDYTRISKRYVVMLLRLHPNAELGINDYTFAYYVDTYGKLAKAITETLDKYLNRNDITKVNFSKWDDTGLTVTAFFSELPSSLGKSYFGTNDVDFIPREKQLTQDECNFLESLDMCAGIKKPTDAEYEDFCKYLKIATVKHPEKYVKKGFEAPASFITEVGSNSTPNVPKVELIDKPMTEETVKDETKTASNDDEWC